jgi:hypothetical protein
LINLYCRYIIFNLFDPAYEMNYSPFHIYYIDFFSFDCNPR